MNDATTFDALPVRRRDVLEIFDTGIKLYRRYFWVLIAWSAIPNLGSAVPKFLIGQSDMYALSALPYLAGLMSFFLTPLEIGAVSCCIAGAVRGQPIGFKQCWKFVKPRYWAVVGQYFLTSLASLLAFFVIFLLGALICALIAVSLEYSHIPDGLKILAWIVVGLILTVVGAVLTSVIWAWQTMTPIVVCLEDDRRSSAQGRTWDLLRRNWWRTTGLFSLLGLGTLALLGIIGATAAMSVGLSGLQKAFTGNTTSLAQFTSGLEMVTIVSALAQMFGFPLLRLITAVLYLDLRVRKEALDLEWAAHVSAPHAETAANGSGSADAAPGMYTPTPPADPTSTGAPTFAGAAPAMPPTAAPGPYMPSSATAEPAPTTSASSGELAPPAPFTGPDLTPMAVPTSEAPTAGDIAPATSPVVNWEPFSPGTAAAAPSPATAPTSDAAPGSPVPDTAGSSFAPPASASSHPASPPPQAPPPAPPPAPSRPVTPPRDEDDDMPVSSFGGFSG